MIIGMVAEAKETGDDDLKTAALFLNKFAFGTSKFTPPQKLAKEADPKEKEKESTLTQKEREFQQRQIDVATEQINTRINNVVKSDIENNIDPNGAMGDLVKRYAVRDALEKITGLIEKDTRFQKIVDKLWEKAAAKNFSQESQDEIKKAFLSKAKSLLAPVIKSARNEALRGVGRKVKSDSEDIETKDEVKPNRERTPERRPSSGDTRAKLDSVKGLSSFEALNKLMGD